MSKLELYYPVKPNNINQPFGVNIAFDYSVLGLKGHNGIDFFATDNQVIRATHDGEVSYAGVDSKEGYGVVIRTLEPFQYNLINCHFKTIYWHLIKEIPIKVGQHVKAGDVIGYADNTGMSTGTHLHFGLKPQIAGENDWTWMNLEQDNGYFGAIDPTPYFNGYFAQDAQLVISILQQIIEIYKSIINKLKI